MFSYYAPPYKSMYGTQRISKFIKYLMRAGWHISLVTSQPRLGDVDREEEHLPPDCRVERIAASKAEALGGFGLLVPDDFLTWVRPAVRAAEKIIENECPAAIFATAPPYSNLIAGAICAKRFELPLYSDFRDPWSKVDVLWKIDRPVLRSLNRELEKIILGVSDHIIMADDADYAEDYFADSKPDVTRKIVSIPNGYDEEDFHENDSNPALMRDRFVVSCVGSLYSRDAFENLIAAFELWRSRFPDDMENVLFEYAGPHSRYFHERNDLPFQLVDHSYVSHSEAIAIRRRSSVQLFAQPSWFKDHVLSGKIYEMLRTGVPIVAFTNRGSAVSKLLDRTGAGYAVNQNDEESAVSVLRNLYQNWRDGKTISHGRADRINEYSRENLAKRLSGLLESDLSLSAGANSGNSRIDWLYER
jgi:glycosyltransferase involved in cell wall biosynthesis